MEQKDRKSIISATWDKVASTITFGVLNVGTLTLDVRACGEALAETACFHGYEQKVRDAAALSRDTKTGRSATPQEKFAAMKRMVDQLHAGEWNVGRSGQVPLNRAALFEAVATARNLSAKVVYERMQSKPDDVLRAFLTDRNIAAEYARITAPSDTSAADALLAECGASS